MDNVSNMSTIYVDREEASEILKVSTRTLDRYVRKFRFKIRKDGRRVLIKRADLEKISENNVRQKLDRSSTMLDKKLDSVSNMSNMSNIDVKDVKVESVKQSAEFAEGIYKNLYQETKKELKEKQERLEAATYRVGQLESQVKQMVPLLDFTRKEKELKEARTAVELKEIEKAEALHKMGRKIKTERIAKWIYLSLVGMLLVVEPILFLLWAFS